MLRISLPKSEKRAVGCRRSTNCVVLALTEVVHIIIYILVVLPVVEYPAKEE